MTNSELIATRIARHVDAVPCDSCGFDAHASYALTGNVGEWRDGELVSICDDCRRHAVREGVRFN